MRSNKPNFLFDPHKRGLVEEYKDEIYMKAKLRTFKSD